MADEPEISPSDFTRLQHIIEKDSGIFVANPSLLVQRLSKRLHQLDVASFGAYAERVELDTSERQEMLEGICTHETRFFREPQQFDYLERELCDRWIRQADAGSREARLRIWSAGCATGEEPYSLAMVLRSRMPTWRLEVLASDLSRAALDRVATGTWPIARAEDIPERYLRRYMLEGTGSLAGHMRAADELRTLVRTARINLAKPCAALQGAFDAIYCRNVLIYFREELRTQVIERMLSHLAPGGYLFLGHAEGLGRHEHGVRAVGPIVYQSASESAA